MFTTHSDRYLPLASAGASAELRRRAQPSRDEADRKFGRCAKLEKELFVPDIGLWMPLGRWGLARRD